MDQGLSRSGRLPLKSPSPDLLYDGLGGGLGDGLGATAGADLGLDGGAEAGASKRGCVRVLTRVLTLASTGFAGTVTGCGRFWPTFLSLRLRIIMPRSLPSGEEETDTFLCVSNAWSGDLQPRSRVMVSRSRLRWSSVLPY